MAFDSEPPPMFNSSGARESIDVCVPLQIDPASNDRNGYFSVAARLKPGMSLGAVRAQLRLATRDCDPHSGWREQSATYPSAIN